VKAVDVDCCAHKKFTDKKIEKNFINLKEVIKSILNQLITTFSPRDFDIDNKENRALMFWLGYLISDSAYLANKFHFEFELDRLEFNSFGLTSMPEDNPTTTLRQQMLISFFLLVKIMLGQILIMVEGLFPEVKFSDSRKISVKVVASTLQLLIVNKYKEEDIPVNYSN